MRWVGCGNLKGNRDDGCSRPQGFFARVYVARVSSMCVHVILLVFCIFGKFVTVTFGNLDLSHHWNTVPIHMG